MGQAKLTLKNELRELCRHLVTGKVLYSAKIRSEGRKECKLL
jgi:hypothetical protein